MKVGFLSGELQLSVKVNYVRTCVVTDYPLLRQCYKCGRIGHSKNACRAKERCLKCGDENGCKGDCETMRLTMWRQIKRSVPNGKKDKFMDLKQKI